MTERESHDLKNAVANLSLRIKRLKENTDIWLKETEIALAKARKVIAQVKVNMAEREKKYHG
jgi:hypothetical protein